jgi:putative ABC transport system ATP-binding protein
VASPVFATKGLRKDHGWGEARVEALRGVDMEIAAGEFVAVMGASGSGKSTLLHLLAGLDQPSGGRILLDGADLTALTDDQRTLLRRQRIGLIFQSFHLLDMLTAEENVALPLAIEGCAPGLARQRAACALECVGLTQRGRHRPHELSGGEQQRVAIARALVIEPRILLADEPTGNLDSIQAAKIIALLRRLVDERRQTVLMVTHDTGHAALADRTLVLKDGRILNETTTPRPANGGLIFSPTLSIEVKKAA